MFSIYRGASLELTCTSLGIQVYGYDSFPSLVDFWHEILKNPLELAERAEKHLLSRKIDFMLYRNLTCTSETKQNALPFSMY